jgi:hypothetical protein
LKSGCPSHQSLRPSLHGKYDALSGIEDRRGMVILWASMKIIEDVLKGCKGGRAMNLEELDGFFSALIAGPDPYTQTDSDELQTAQSMMLDAIIANQNE